jgi:hypothetical protein
MNTTMKWILGILVGLVLISGLSAAGFLVLDRWSGAERVMGPRLLRPWDGGREFPWERDQVFPEWGMPGRSVMRIFPLRWVLLGLVCPGILLLVVLCALALVFNRGRSPAPVQPVPPPSAIAEPTPPVPSSSLSACPNCGYPVVEAWKHCPNCGTALGDQEG